VVLIHDLRQANEFSEILKQCPKSLLDRGLFDHLAVALYGGDYQHVSLQLLWQRLSSDLSGTRRNSNLLSRNVVMPQPAFSQKSLLGTSLNSAENSQSMSKVAPAAADSTKEDEARVEMPTATLENQVVEIENLEFDANLDTESAPPRPGRENRLGSIDRLMAETGVVDESS
jgi:hypothetical protein